MSGQEPETVFICKMKDAETVEKMFQSVDESAKRVEQRKRARAAGAFPLIHPDEHKKSLSSWLTQHFKRQKSEPIFSCEMEDAQAVQGMFQAIERRL